MAPGANNSQDERNSAIIFCEIFIITSLCCFTRNTTSCPCAPPLPPVVWGLDPIEMSFLISFLQNPSSNNQSNCRGRATGRALDCEPICGSYRPVLSLPESLHQSSQCKAHANRSAAKSVNFSVERTRDTVETVEVTTVSTSRAQP